MTIDAGDMKYQPGHRVTLDANGNTVEGGEAVTFDSNGDIQRATDTDLLVGTTLPSEMGDDDKWAVAVCGLCLVVETDYDASAGDFLQPAAAGDGTYQDAGAVGPDSPLPFVLEEEDSDDNLYVAVFR